MEYLKPHLSISQQTSLLMQRGLMGDASLLATRLKNVGYYRFSAYLHPFRVRNQQGVIGLDPSFLRFLFFLAWLSPQLLQKNQDVSNWQATQNQVFKVHFSASSNLKWNIACKGIKRRLQAMDGAQAWQANSPRWILGCKVVFCGYPQFSVSTGSPKSSINWNLSL